MVRVGQSKNEDRTRYAKYAAVGRALLTTAEGLDAIEDAKYGNGLAIVAIHACIAYTDALTVAYREMKSTDGDHVRAADLLLHALGHRAAPEQVTRLKAILHAKSHASYSGTYYTIDDGRRLLGDARSYIRWAEQMLAGRPA